MKKNLKRKLIILVCFCAMILFAPAAVMAETSTTVPGAEGHTLETYSLLSFYFSPVKFNVTPNVGIESLTREQIAPPGGITGVLYTLPEFNENEWKFSGWRTYYSGEKRVSGKVVETVAESNPILYSNRYAFGASSRTLSLNGYPTNQMQWHGTYYISAIFKPIIDIHKGDGVESVTVTGTDVESVPSDSSSEKYAVKYGTDVTITYTLEEGYVLDYAAGTGGAEGKVTVEGNTVTLTGCDNPGGVEIIGKAVPAEHVCAGGVATCKSPAICTTCGEPHGEMDPSNHTGGTEVRDAVAAGEFTEGYTGDTYCLGCNALLAKGEATPATHKHFGGEATCVSGPICQHEKCGQEYGESNPNNHVGDTEIRGEIKVEHPCQEGYSGDLYCLSCNQLRAKGNVKPASDHDNEIKYDASGHWQQCKDCGETGEKQNHEFVDGVCSCGYEEPEEDPVTPSDPTGPTDPTEPAVPSDPADPTEPAVPSDPADPTEPAVPSDPGASTDNDKESAANGNETANKDKAPATGDDFQLSKWIILLVMLAFMLFVLKGRRRF